MKHRVSLQRLSDYQPERVDEQLRALLAPLGGIEAFVKPGQKVLLKPNLLSGKAPDKAVTTHPEILRATIRLVQQAGGIVSVGDSPGVGSPQQVAQRCGILSVVEETGATFAPFQESVRVKPPGATFQELEIAQDILDADVIINLPKLKTHQMMGLTCAVKNLYGAVVGMRKARLHLQAGTDKAFFATMLLDLANFVRPALTIVDAVVGMEGDGPGSGDPVQIGALLAGENLLAIDAVALALVGMNPDLCWTQKVAAAKDLPGCRLSEVDLVGTELEELRLSSFRPSKVTDVNFGLKPVVKRILKRHISAYPVVLHDTCQRCGLCVKHCPPTAMAIVNGRLKIDYQRCIGCFCCQELCPHAALLTRQGLMLRLIRFLQNR